MRFPPDFLSVYEQSADGRDANIRLRHPDPPDDANRAPWRFRDTEMDPAGHINNSHYWTPLEEGLPAELPSIDAEVEYRDPAMPGDAAVLRSGGSLWIAAPDGAVNASVLLL